MVNATCTELSRHDMVIRPPSSDFALTLLITQRSRSKLSITVPRYLFWERIVRAFLIAASAVLWVLTAQAQSDKSDFDLVCAITTGAQLSLGQDEQRSAATMAAHSFYIGRLSVRDDHTNWATVVASRLAEKQWAEPSPRLLGKCLDFYASKFKH